MIQTYQVEDCLVFGGEDVWMVGKHLVPQLLCFLEHAGTVPRVL